MMSAPRTRWKTFRKESNHQQTLAPVRRRAAAPNLRDEPGAERPGNLGRKALSKAREPAIALPLKRKKASKKLRTCALKPVLPAAIAAGNAQVSLAVRCCGYFAHSEHPGNHRNDLGEEKT